MSTTNLILSGSNSGSLGIPSRPWTAVHADEFHGDGSNLTGLTIDQVTGAAPADNYLTTYDNIGAALQILAVGNTITVDTDLTYTPGQYITITLRIDNSLNQLSRVVSYNALSGQLQYAAPYSVGAGVANGNTNHDGEWDINIAETPTPRYTTQSIATGGQMGLRDSQGQQLGFGVAGEIILGFDLQYEAGDYVKIAYQDPQLGSGYQVAEVTSYDTETGVLVFDTPTIVSAPFGGANIVYTATLAVAEEVRATAAEETLQTNIDAEETARIAADASLATAISNISGSGGSGTMGGTMTSHIIPDTNALYDLGNAEYKIRHLFLSDNSLWVGDDHKISIDSNSGKMKFRKRKDQLPLELRNLGLDETGASLKRVEELAIANGLEFENLFQNNGDFDDQQETSFTSLVTFNEGISVDSGAEFVSNVVVHESVDVWGNITGPTITSLNDATAAEANRAQAAEQANASAVVAEATRAQAAEQANANAIAAIDTSWNGTLAAGTDMNIDAGTLFVDASDGKVGIGTVSPSSTFDVAGSIHSDGAASLDGAVTLGSSFNYIHNGQVTTGYHGTTVKGNATFERQSTFTGQTTFNNPAEFNGAATFEATTTFQDNATFKVGFTNDPSGNTDIPVFMASPDDFTSSGTDEDPGITFIDGSYANLGTYTETNLHKAFTISHPSDWTDYVAPSNANPDDPPYISANSAKYPRYGDKWHVCFKGSSSNLHFRFEDGGKNTLSNPVFDNAGESTGTGGYISSNTNTTAQRMNFTGQHRCLPTDASSQDFLQHIGKIVCASGDYKNFQTDENLEKPNINQSLPKVELTSKQNQKSAFGVVSDVEDPEGNREYSSGNFVSILAKPQDGDDRIFVNSVGEGAIWVTNINGDLENGDYITTCEIPGYGMLQDDDLLHNYTVAKITMDCDFDLNSDKYECVEVTHNGQSYRAAFVGCTYHCG